MNNEKKATSKRTERTNNKISMQLNAFSERKTSTNKDIQIAVRHSMYEEMWTDPSSDCRCMTAVYLCRMLTNRNNEKKKKP